MRMGALGFTFSTRGAMMLSLFFFSPHAVSISKMPRKAIVSICFIIGCIVSADKSTKKIAFYRHFDEKFISLWAKCENYEEITIPIYEKFNLIQKFEECMKEEFPDRDFDFGDRSFQEN